jgi:hypothetical protein
MTLAIAVDDHGDRVFEHRPTHELQRPVEVLQGLQRLELGSRRAMLQVV